MGLDRTRAGGFSRVTTNTQRQSNRTQRNDMKRLWETIKHTLWAWHQLQDENTCNKTQTEIYNETEREQPFLLQTIVCIRESWATITESENKTPRLENIDPIQPLHNFNNHQLKEEQYHFCFTNLRLEIVFFNLNKKNVKIYYNVLCKHLLAVLLCIVILVHI